MSQQRDFEIMLDRLQDPAASHQDRLHAQQFALTLQNPVDFSELDEAALSQAVDAKERTRLATAKRLGQLQHLLDNSHSPISQVTLVTGPSRSLSLKLSDTRVNEPQIRARLGTTAHFREVAVLKLRTIAQVVSLQVLEGS